MAKKKFNFNLKVSYDAPVTLTFVIISAIFFLLNTFLLKNGELSKLLASPTSVSGALPFIVSQPVSYLRLLFYIFGSNEGAALFTNLILIMLLGPAMEERYGSAIIGIMIFVSALFSGVLNACFCTESLVGALPLVSMMIFLNAFMSFSKKKFPLSFVAVIVFFVVLQIFSGNGVLRIIICIAGGLCGSLFALLTSPKARAEKKSSGSGNSRPAASSPAPAKKRGGLLSRAEKVAYAEELDRNSPRNKGKSSDDDDTTVVGTLKF